MVALCLTRGPSADYRATVLVRENHCRSHTTARLHGSTVSRATRRRGTQYAGKESDPLSATHHSPYLRKCFLVEGKLEQACLALA